MVRAVAPALHALALTAVAVRKATSRSASESQARALRSRRCWPPRARMGIGISRAWPSAPGRGARTRRTRRPSSIWRLASRILEEVGARNEVAKVSVAQGGLSPGSGQRCRGAYSSRTGAGGLQSLGTVDGPRLVAALLELASRRDRHGQRSQPSHRVARPDRP